MFDLTRTRSLAFALATAAGVAFGGDTARATPALAPPAAGPVVRTTLPNGLEIVVLPDRVAPVVSTWLNVRAGSDDEPFAGLAHAQEHMFFRGSATLSGAQADQIAGYTADVDDADTQAIVTQYYHEVPSAELGLVVRVDAARFSGLFDAQSDWNEERGAIEQEVTRDTSDVEYRLGVRIQRHLMAGTPYADDGLGTLASFDRQIQAPQLQAFYHRWYHPNDAVYVVAGDVDPAAAIATIAKSFGGFASVPLPARPAARLAPATAATFADTSDQGTDLAIVAYRYPGLADRDYAASVVLADVLNNQRGALYGLAAAGRVLDVSASASEFPSAGILQITAHAPLATPPARTVTAIERVIERYRASGVPRDLVVAAQRRERAQYLSAGSSIEGLAALWSAVLPAEHRTPADDVAAILAVRPADVDRVLRAYLVESAATVATAVPKAGANGSTGGGGAASGETKAPPPATIAPLPPWARDALAALKPPDLAEPPAEYVLANGLHLIVVPDHSSASVSVAGSIAHDPGLEEPEGQAGVGGVAEELLPYGTQTSSRLAYQAKLDAISATVKTGFDFSFDGSSATFGRGMDLLAEDELHPAFRPADFTIVRDRRAAAVAGEATTPKHVADVARADGLYPEGDPGRWFPSAADIRSLTLDDVRRFYTGTFRPDLTTIAVVGDVTPDDARATIERTFGTWVPHGPAPTVFSQPVRDRTATSTVVPANGVVQDSVVMAQTLGFGDADPAYAPLAVASAILSDGNDFSSMLYRDMRVTTGYVYTVATDVRTGRARSLFTVAYGCSPATYSKAEAVLERDLTQLQTANVDPDRLQRAKSRLLSGYALGRSSYADLAAVTARDGAQGITPEERFARVRREFALTADDVRSAAARWLRPSGFVRTIEGPAPSP